MSARSPGRKPELSALLVTADAELGARLQASLPAGQSFQLVAEIRSYPTEQLLEMRLRQAEPDVLFLDLATDFAAAVRIIEFAARQSPPLLVVGIHHRNDPEALVGALRAGAVEFLCAPFDPIDQAGAATRLQRLGRPESAAPAELGKVVVLSSAKPGAGASTLAVHLALAMRRQTNRRILLADLDIMGGAVAFSLKLSNPNSVLDLVGRSQSLDAAAWANCVSSVHGLDVLPAPEAASEQALEPSHVHELLESARQLYDWVVLDLPNVFHRLSLFALAESDRAFLVSTTELPSLHLARRAVGLLGQLGFERDRFSMLVNRDSRKGGMRQADLEKIFGAPVYAILPNDYHAVYRAVTRAEPLEPGGELGKSVAQLGQRIAGPAPRDRRQAGVLETRPALSES